MVDIVTMIVLIPAVDEVLLKGTVDGVTAFQLRFGDVMMTQPVNDQLLFQTLWAIGQLEFRRG